MELIEDTDTSESVLQCHYLMMLSYFTPVVHHLNILTQDLASLDQLLPNLST